jgi:hypothetical protein
MESGRLGGDEVNGRENGMEKMSKWLDAKVRDGWFLFVQSRYSYIQYKWSLWVTWKTLG